jgi:hypothetical protein
MPGIVKQPQTLYDKVFNDHIVDEKEDGTILLYIGNLLLSLYCPTVADYMHRQASRARGHVTGICGACIVSRHANFFIASF